MNDTWLRNWWLLGLRGVVAILFGVLAMTWPALTLVTLAGLFGAFALFGGAVWIFSAIASRPAEQRWWLMLLLGALSVAAGVIAALHPAITLLVLILLVGANALVTGVIDLMAAVRLRKYMRGEWMLVLSGVASILFGLVVLLFPLGAGAVALALMIGIYAICAGALLIALAIRVRTWARINGGRSSPAAGMV